jgi:hypothetical protein
MGMLYLPQQQILLAPPKAIFNIERSNDLMSLLVIPNGDEINRIVVLLTEVGKYNIKNNSS